MKKKALQIAACGAGAALLGIAGLASIPGGTDTASPDLSLRAAEEPKPSCGPLDSLPGGACSTDQLGDGSAGQPSRNPSDRTLKTDILPADWTRS
ncbi:hypothetical protein ACIBEA_30430 [Streptomyces sp. NPDC051555]|uniref:hypothetical protein n=1 Tax=Streptomyces sp. NPDC051555 TaxID=3365657 RepID=UPI0037BBF8D1